MSNPKLSDFDFDIAALHRYELDRKNEVAKASGAADHRRMMEAINRMGMFPPKDLPLRSATMTPPPDVRPSEPLPAAVGMWLVDCSGKNGARTVDAKAYHFKHFLTMAFGSVDSVERWLAESQKIGFLKNKGLLGLAERAAAKAHSSAEVAVNAMSKQTVVEYKSALLAIPQTPKTIDDKLNSPHDFFKYLIAHGLYTASASNPNEGLFIQTKQARKKTTNPYQPFTPAAIEVLFKPAAYLAAMDAPDLFWGPLLGIHTGMLTSEVTQIRCVDATTRVRTESTTFTSTRGRRRAASSMCRYRTP